ncbi:MAG TPA: hypothetical protein VM327_08170, partial [Candidatus Thermoplasmatota archaeon]|nr:hypothetical protein [Candidatus Thermoplasmatota archaeon]
MRFAYADPPYIGKAHLYADQPTYAGEVDHRALIVSLEDRRHAGELAGWALSCSTESLPFLLSLIPRARICTWVKPLPVQDTTTGILTRTEHVLVVGGRPTRPGIPNFLMAAPARGGGSDLIGRKPVAFSAWLFRLLGMVPGDTLEDLFPGTGQVGRSWATLAQCSATRRACQDDAT